MKRVAGLLAVSVVVTTSVLTAPAQQPAQPPEPHQHGQAAPAPSPSAPSPRRGMMGGGMMGGGMMGGGMMGGGTPRAAGHGGEWPMGLCPTAPMLAHHDAKTSARGLRLCGDILKAIGEVLIKHGVELEKGQ
jgi:hypothetical protein